MYRYDDEGNAVEMKLVDWQLPRLGHPGTDIINFLVSSTSPEIRKKHRRFLLNHYFDVLSSAMEKLGLELYNRGKFLKEMHARMVYGMLYGMRIYPGIFNEKMIIEFEEKDANTAEADKKKTLNMDEVIEDFKDGYSVNQFLPNKFLCDRIVDLVEAVRNAIKNDDWMFLH